MESWRCRAGRLPESLADPAAHPVSAALPATQQVGTYLSVPMRFSDGGVYGTLCGFALHIRDDLDERDLAGLRVVAEAWDHGVGVELETAAVRAAVADYDALLAAIRPLRERGVRLAIDDAGSGFSGLRQILRLQPDLIKVDADLIRSLPTCPHRQAMVAALTTFATRMHTTLVAEGIETAAELDAVRLLGTAAGQGHHIGRPHPHPDHPLALPTPASASQAVS